MSDLMFDKQMEELPAVSQAAAAIGHTLEQISTEPTLGYLCGLGTQTFALLTEAFATIHCQDIDAVRSTFYPHNAKNPKETYAPCPVNSVNSYGEGADFRTVSTGLNEVIFDDEDWAEYQKLQSRVKDLCESFASQECATAPHLASSMQHLDAIQARLEAGR